VLRDDGTCWVNLGDCYSAHAGQRKSTDARGPKQCTNRGSSDLGSRDVAGLKAKDIVGIPWRVAFALQADGWYLRSDIIWSKCNPMPESVTDRPTKAHEYIFLLSKSERYFYDAEAIKEPASEGTHERYQRAHAEHCPPGQSPHSGIVGPRKRAPNGSGIKSNDSFDAAMRVMPETRNKRSVWTVPTAGYNGAHFATFPPDLIRPCILAGCSTGGTVLDPFAGSGTTGMVALDLGRNAVLIELNPEYIQMIRERTNITVGLGL
jgi:DNA modification methylase